MYMCISPISQNFAFSCQNTILKRKKRKQQNFVFYLPMTKKVGLPTIIAPTGIFFLVLSNATISLDHTLEGRIQSLKGSILWAYNLHFVRLAWFSLLFWELYSIFIPKSKLARRKVVMISLLIFNQLQFLCELKRQKIVVQICYFPNFMNWMLNIQKNKMFDEHFHLGSIGYTFI